MFVCCAYTPPGCVLHARQRLIITGLHTQKREREGRKKRTWLTSHASQLFSRVPTRARRSHGRRTQDLSFHSLRAYVITMWTSFFFLEMIQLCCSRIPPHKKKSQVTFSPVLACLTCHFDFASSSSICLHFSWTLINKVPKGVLELHYYSIV